MSCRVCSHTIQRVNDGDSPRVFWCPRCGSLGMPNGVPDHEAPMLVERIRRTITRLEDPVLGIDTSQFDDLLRTLKETIGVK